MITISKKNKIIFVLVSLAVIAVIAVANFTEVCKLEAVTINGELSNQWQKKSTLTKDKSILRQPLAEFVETSLTDDHTLKMDFSYAWPHTLKIETNRINPDCLLLDMYSSTMFGLDKLGRVLPLSFELIDWERPILTGAGVKQIYQYSTDIRIHEVLVELSRLRNDRINFYRLIEQIDFSAPDYLDVKIAGCAQVVRLRAEYFYDDMNRYISFVAKYRPILDGIKIIDLRQEGQIVTKGKRV